MYGVAMTAAAKHFAIKTGTIFALITVHYDAGCCTAEGVDGILITVAGTDDEAICRCARNCMGVSWRTLKALRESTTAAVVRRTDLDW